MSVASATRQIKFIRRTGSITASIYCDNGDLWQEYTSDHSSVAPEISSESGYQPSLYLLVTTSRQVNGTYERVPVAMPDVYVNGSKITFNASGVSLGTWAGKFKKVQDPSTSRYGIKVLGNLAEIAGWQSVTVTMEGQIQDDTGTSLQSVKATYTISIMPMTDTGYSVHIVPGGSTADFVIEKSGETVALKAVAYNQGAPVGADNLTFKWYKLGLVGSNLDWVLQKSGKGASFQELTVSESDIDTYGSYKVEVLKDQTQIGTDTQGVWDVQDPYDIDVVPSRTLAGSQNGVPCDETIYEGDASQSEIYYAPRVVSRSSGAEAADFKEDGKFYFYFTLVTPAGLIVNSSDTKQYYFKVDSTTISENGYADLELIIESAANT